MHDLPVDLISALRLHLCCWHSHSQVHSSAGSTVNCTDCSPSHYQVRVGLVMVSRGDHLSDVAGLEADVERPLEELLARRFSSVSRPARRTAQLNAEIKVLVHNALLQSAARLQPTCSAPSDTYRLSSAADVLTGADLSEVKAV